MYSRWEKGKGKSGSFWFLFSNSDIKGIISQMNQIWTRKNNEAHHSIWSKTPFIKWYMRHGLATKMCTMLLQFFTKVQ